MCETKFGACAEVGIRSEHHALPGSTSAVELLDLIASLNRQGDVDGILVQLPLPDEIDEGKIIEAIDPEKDVDGFHQSTSAVWQWADRRWCLAHRLE